MSETILQLGPYLFPVWQYTLGGIITDAYRLSKLGFFGHLNIDLP